MREIKHFLRPIYTKILMAYIVVVIIADLYTKNFLWAWSLLLLILVMFLLDSLTLARQDHIDTLREHRDFLQYIVKMNRKTTYE